MMTTPRPILYHPLIPPLVKSNITCPRCQHRTNSFVLDDFPNNHPRPSCLECKSCFPEKMGQTTNIKSKVTPVALPAIKKLAPRVTTAPKTSPRMSAIQFKSFTAGPEDASRIKSELDAIALTSPETPKVNSRPKDHNPNGLFFGSDDEEEATYADILESSVPDEQDDEEEASYTELLKSSAPDNTQAQKRWTGPAIGSERGKGTC